MDVDGARPIKPEDWFRHKDSVLDADWLLFPAYWQVNALVYGWKKRIFPSISSYHLGHDKVEMTRALEAVLPAHVPHTRILAATDSGLEEVLDTFDFPFVAKEVRSSMGNGVHMIESRAQLHHYARGNPVMYVQECLPINRDLRVVLVGDTVAGAYWREGAPGSFHNNVARGGRVDFSGVPDHALELARQAAAALNIDHAGFDLACTGGHWYFLEFNVFFGTQALNARGIRVGTIILDYLQRHTAPPVEPGHPPLPLAV